MNEVIALLKMAEIQVSPKTMRVFVNRAIAILEKPTDTFEIRIPNLRQEEMPFVQDVIAKVTKSLLNTLTLRRAGEQN